MTAGEGAFGAVLEALQDSRYDELRASCYLALDVPDWESARPMVETLGPAVTGYKVGLELFHGDGPRALAALQDMGKRVFLDVKLHDIPNTVAGALRVIRDLGVEMVNVHAQGGVAMLKAAREAVEGGVTRPYLIGVTVLTSLGDSDFTDLGYSSDVAQQSQALTARCVECGLDGVVTSGRELALLRAHTPNGFQFVVPGTRPTWAASNDQVRTLTPKEAIAGGASSLVIGRAVTSGNDPVRLLQRLWDEVIADEH